MVITVEYNRYVTIMETQPHRLKGFITYDYVTDNYGVVTNFKSDRPTVFSDGMEAVFSVVYGALEFLDENDRRVQSYNVVEQGDKEGFIEGVFQYVRPTARSMGPHRNTIKRRLEA